MITSLLKLAFGCREAVATAHHSQFRRSRGQQFRANRNLAAIAEYWLLLLSLKQQSTPSRRERTRRRTNLGTGHAPSGSRLRRSALGLKSSEPAPPSPCRARAAKAASPSQRGLSCPEDMSTVGHNDMPLMDMVSPPRPSESNTARWGRKAARLLVESLDRGEQSIRHVVLELDLVARASTRRLG